MIDQNNKEKHILETVDKLAEEMIDFACRLVAEPSTVGHEMAVMTVMAGQRTLKSASRFKMYSRIPAIKHKQIFPMIVCANSIDRRCSWKLPPALRYPRAKATARIIPPNQ